MAAHDRIRLTGLLREGPPARGLFLFLVALTCVLAAPAGIETEGSRGHEYGRKTLEGVASRLLRGLRR
jgi:hypothetical protein